MSVVDPLPCKCQTYTDMGEYTAGSTLPKGWIIVFGVDGPAIVYTDPGGTQHSYSISAGETMTIYSDGSSWTVSYGTVRVLVIARGDGNGRVGDSGSTTEL